MPVRNRAAEGAALVADGLAHVLEKRSWVSLVVLLKMIIGIEA